MDAKTRIIKERMKLLISHNFAFFGYLALGLELKEEPQVGTLGTDGFYLFYNPEYVNRLGEKELLALVAHGVLHPGLGHIWRRGEREKERWNHATDHVINLILKDAGFTLPSKCLLDEKFRGMSAEQIYMLLPEECKCGGQLMDSHDKWGSGGSSKQTKSGGSDDKEDGKESDKVFGAGRDQSNARDLEKTWKERLARASALARMRGKLPSAVSAMVDDILQPKLDWRTMFADKLLSQVKNNYRFVPPNKMHVWRGIYLPSMYGEQIELGFAVDSSGSVSLGEFQEFIAEGRGIIEQFEGYILHLFFCDAAVHDRMIITPQDEWPSAFPKAGGGTDFRPVFKRIEEDQLNVSVLVYLTDGDGKYPEYPPDYPVIWLLNKDYLVPWGEKILMEGSMPASRS